MKKTNVRTGGGYPLVSNGFTLIELLAVIVILAIIALIATPIILGIIGDSKESSTIRSAEMYITATEQAIARKNLESEFSPSSCEILENGEVVDVQNIKLNEYYVYQEDNKLVISKEPLAIKTIYQDSILSGSDPVLSGMTAVVYNGDNWLVADAYSEWYDYANQEWANAVILKSGVTKNVGDTIDVSSEVKAMFVWIPRYEYKIDGTYGTHTDGTEGTAELPGEIEVNFISKDVTTASEGYIVHPAFTFGTDELSGIWVGKFETSTDTSSTCYKNCSTSTYNDICITYCNNTNQDPYIIPNVSSLRYQQVSNQFQTAQKFNSYITNADSHMMKNSEWGAVAYLSQSIYGKYGNSDYIGTQKEIYQNKSTSLITGSSNGTPSTSTTNTQCTYDNTTNNCGIGASTTGNITGIYDMSGGSQEYVMGVFANSSGQLWSGYVTSDNSGYTGLVGSSGTSYTGTAFPDLKYYDVYKATSGTTISSTTACNGGICYGHALSETSGWYGDYAYFVSTNNPWFTRGGYFSHDAHAGVFDFGSYSGNRDYINSFRVVVSQTTN